MHILIDTALNMSILQCLGRVCLWGGASNRMTVECGVGPPATGQAAAHPAWAPS